MSERLTSSRRSRVNYGRRLKLLSNSETAELIDTEINFANVAEKQVRI